MGLSVEKGLNDPYQLPGVVGLGPGLVNSGPAAQSNVVAV